MKHLKESEFIAYFYGESSQPDQDKEHLEFCGECAAAYKALTRDIELAAREMDQETVPARAAGYGDEVWRSLHASLLPYEPKRGQLLRWFPRSHARLTWSVASAAAVLVLFAFLAGRLWEQKFTPQRVPAQSAAKDAPEKPDKPDKLADPLTTQHPVIVVLLSDHLERSERLLVELNHPDEAVVDPTLQATARQLLAENRRYRQTAGGAGSVATDGKSQDKSNSKPGETSDQVEILESSPAMTLTLNDLDRVLGQVADEPDGLSRAEIAQVKQQINASGLLFEVRILRSRAHHAPTRSPNTRREGTA